MTWHSDRDLEKNVANLVGNYTSFLCNTTIASLRELLKYMQFSDFVFNTGRKMNVDSNRYYKIMFNLMLTLLIQQILIFTDFIS